MESHERMNHRAGPAQPGATSPFKALRSTRWQRKPIHGGGLALQGRNHARRFAAEAAKFVMAGSEFLHQHATGTFWHGVITTGEHIHSGIARLGPTVKRDVRFSQQGQPRNAVGLEVVADQVEQGGPGPKSGIAEGSPDKNFIIELGAIAGIKLKDAMLSNRIRDRSGDRIENTFIQRSCRRRSAGGRGSGPSRIGMEIAEGEAHRDETRIEVMEGGEGLGRTRPNHTSLNLTLFPPAIRVECPTTRGVA